MENLHSLLKRQLKKRGLDPDAVPDEWAGLLETVNAAYREFDEDRRLLERSLDLSSRELLQANSKMRAVLQAFPDLFLRLDTNGTVLQIECRGDDDLYLPRENLKGRRIQDIPNKEIARRLSEALDRVRETGAQVTVEYSLPIKNLATFYEARLLPLVGGTVLAIIRNITERKQAEADTQRIEQERMKATKLESLGLMSGGIAHDFNNILAAIMSNLSLVRAAYVDKPEIDEILGDAELACQRAKDLTRQLLTFSKGGAPIKIAASIKELIEEITVFALRGSNVISRFDLADDLRPVEIDVGQISQVINNLVINAYQAMPAGGTVKISARNMAREETGGFPLPDRDYVEIVIADHGVGIPKEHLNAIFDPYFSTKQMGSGLGLATSYSILQRHDGFITVHSQEGVGTRMTLYLPAAVEFTAVLTIPPAQLIKGEGRVLVMDDEEQILRASGRLLRLLGYEVGFARDGAEAIEQCRQAHAAGECFTLVIMDLTIPGGMGGQEAAVILREQYPDLKLVASSGYSNDPVLSNHTAYGFVGILPKPYSLAELNALLQRLLSESGPLKRVENL